MDVIEEKIGFLERSFEVENLIRKNYPIYKEVTELFLSSKLLTFANTTDNFLMLSTNIAT